MILHKLVVGPLGTNCYVLVSDNKEAVVIDPGGDAKTILELIRKKELIVKLIILTHGHYDHIGAIVEILKNTNAPIYVHKDDEALLKEPSRNLSLYLGHNFSIDLPLENIYDGQVLTVGDLELGIIHTPGHTPGSVSIKASNILFTGDLLFAGSVGRTDLSGGSFETLMNSLKQILNFSDETRILPGHGEETTIKEEKELNPFLRDLL
ncbi:MAG TPA: MBL fold metallo-hydrolase [Actinobacteria bacterium]|nr:MBL fold metallo-hydrolase [Actinomycetota bacterium]